jgi:DNA-binding MarR family transcriptional regulator
VPHPRSRFGAPERSPGFLLWRATLDWQRQIRAALEPHELTHVQFVLLASLWWIEAHAPAPPTQAQLAAHAGTDPMMTSQVLRKLEARALLVRAPDENDTRARRLRLTDAGRELTSVALRDVEAADSAFFSPLGAEQPSFVAALAALAAAHEHLVG